MTINHPLRLAVGSHQAGSGKGCAMNVISWESGDSTITDMPAYADRLLAWIVQRVNDTICTHRDGDLLCPECSVQVLDLGHRIVGTGTHPLTDAERHRVWVWVAADQARQVAHLSTDPRVMAAIEAAEGWCEGTVTAEQCSRAARGAYTDAARATYAAAAAAWAHAADALAAERLRLAHRAVDVWCERAGFVSTPTDPQVTAEAVARMRVTA